MISAPTLFVVHAVGEREYESLHTSRERAEAHADELRMRGVIVVVRSLDPGSRTPATRLPRPRTPWGAR